jgi:hypothetical protein
VKKFIGLLVAALFLAMVAKDAPALAAGNSASIKTVGVNGASSIRSIDLRFAITGAIADQSLDCRDLSNRFSDRIRFRFSLSGKNQTFSLGSLSPTSGSAVPRGLECNAKVINPVDALSLGSNVFIDKPWLTGTVSLQIDGKTKSTSKFRLLSPDLKPAVSLLTPVEGKILGKDVLLAFGLAYEKEFTYTSVKFNVCLASAPICELPRVVTSENEIAKFRTEGKTRFYVQPKSSGTFRLVTQYTFTNNSIGGTCQEDSLRCVSVNSDTVFSASTQKVIPVDANYIDVSRSSGSMNLKCNYASYKTSFRCRVRPQIEWHPSESMWSPGDPVPTTGSIRLFVEVLYGPNGRYYERYPITVKTGSWSKYFIVSNKKWTGGIDDRPILDIRKVDTELNTSALWDTDELLIGKY